MAGHGGDGGCRDSTQQRPRRNCRDGHSTRRAPTGRAGERHRLQPRETGRTGPEEHRRSVAPVAGPQLSTQRHELRGQLQRRRVRHQHPRRRFDGRHLDHRHLYRRHADPDAALGLRRDQCLPGTLRLGPGRGVARPAGHAVRRRRRGRRGALPGARSGAQQIERLCARGRRGHRRRRAELGRRRCIRRAHHRRRARVPRQHLVSQGRRLGRSFELHALEPLGAVTHSHLHRRDAAEFEFFGNPDCAPGRQVAGHR